MSKTTRFDDDVEIFRDLPDAQKIAIGEAFHSLITAALIALRLRSPAETPPSQQPSPPATRREAP